MLFLPQKGAKDFELSGLRYNEELIEYLYGIFKSLMRR